MLTHARAPPSMELCSRVRVFVCVCLCVCVCVGISSKSHRQLCANVRAYFWNLKLTLSIFFIFFCLRKSLESAAGRQQHSVQADESLRTVGVRRVHAESAHSLRAASACAA